MYKTINIWIKALSQKLRFSSGVEGLMKKRLTTISSAKGASMIETAIAIPLLAFIFIVLLDVGVYFTSKGISASAAAEAANYASTVENLDSSDNDERLIALRKVRNLGTESATSFLMKDIDSSGPIFLYVPDAVKGSSIAPYSSPENEKAAVQVYFPVDTESSDISSKLDANPTYLGELMRQRPFEVRVNSKAKTILLGYLFGGSGDVDTSASVLAYRQTYNESANPLPLDCGGDAGLATTDGCLCDAGDPSKIIDVDGTCICRGDLLQLDDGSCGCPPGALQGEEEFTCICEILPECEPGYTVNEKTCACERISCPIDESGMESMLWSEETHSCSVCNPATCPGIKEINDPSSCDCVDCEDELVSNPDNNKCVCTNYYEGYCGEDKIYKPDCCCCFECAKVLGEFAVPISDFECGCPEELHEQGYAACAARGMEFNPEKCSCEPCRDLEKFYPELDEGRGRCDCPDRVGDQQGTQEALDHCHSINHFFKSHVQKTGYSMCKCVRCQWTEINPETNKCECLATDAEIEECLSVPGSTWTQCQCRRCPFASWDNRIWKEAEQSCECEEENGPAICTELGSEYYWDKYHCLCKDRCDGKDGYSNSPNHGSKCKLCEGNFTAHETERRCICPIECSNIKYYKNSDTCECELCPRGEVANSSNDGCVPEGSSGPPTSGPYEGI